LHRRSDEALHLFDGEIDNPSPIFRQPLEQCWPLIEPALFKSFREQMRERRQFPVDRAGLCAGSEARFLVALYIVITLATVQPEPVSWLWKPYISRRKLTIVEGDPGIGKTWLMLQIAAAVSRGARLPGMDGTPQTRQDHG
jgi:hypothetical protein